MKHSAVAVLMIVAAAVLFLSPSLFTSSVLLPGDNLIREFALQSPQGETSEKQPGGDVLAQFYPFFSYFKDQVQKGVFPLWNPLIFCGTPFLANTVSALLFPLNWIIFLIPVDVYFEIAALLKLILAGSGIFLFARKIRVPVGPAVFSSVAYMFSGYQVFFLMFPNSWVSALFGWVLYATEWTIDSKSRKAFSVLAFLTGLSFLAGHIESAVLLAMASGLYTLVRKWNMSLAVAISLLLGFLIASILVFPFVEALIESSTYTDRGQFPRNPFHLNIAQIALLIVPYAQGSSVSGQAGATFLGAVYTGIIPLFLSVFALFDHTLRKFVLSLFAVAAGAFVILYGIYPFFDIFTSVPVLKVGNHLHVTQIFQGVICLLGGLGLAYLTENRMSRNRLIVVSTVFLVWLSYSWWYCYQPQLSSDSSIGSYLFFNSRFSFPIYPILTLFVLLVLILTIRHPLLPKVTLGLAVANGLTFGMFFNPLTSHDETTRTTPHFVETIQSFDHERFVHIGFGTAPPNYLMTYGLRDVRGYESVVPSNIPPIIKILTGPQPNAHHFVPGLNKSRIDLLKRMGCTLVSSFRKIRSSHLKLIDTKTTPVYRLEGPGRVLYANRITFVNSPEDALDHISQSVDPSFVALETQEKSSVPDTRNGQNSTISWLEDNSNQVKLEVNHPNGGWLVLRDTYYPGWTARIDGRETEIVRADYLFRAVEVPAGEHIVEFHYKPLSFTIGLIISLLTILGLVLFWVSEKKG